MADTRIDGSSVLEDMSCDQHENEYIKRSAMFVHLDSSLRVSRQ